MERKNWINKLDDLEGDKPVASNPRKSPSFNFGGGQEKILVYALAGAGAVILILFIILFFRGGKESSTAELQEAFSRLEMMERQMAGIESQAEERQRVFSRVIQIDQDLRAGLESQREALDDLRQKIAQMEKSVQQPAPRPAPVSAPPRQEQAETRPAAESEGNNIYHEVQRGDNLFRIGLKYNISVDRIRELNNLSPNDSIHPGDKLVVGTKGD